MAGGVRPYRKAAQGCEEVGSGFGGTIRLLGLKSGLLPPPYVNWAVEKRPEAFGVAARLRLGKAPPSNVAWAAEALPDASGVASGLGLGRV